MEDGKYFWHALSVDETFKILESNKDGLTDEEHKKRIKIYGLNELPKESAEPAWKLFLSQFNSPLMYLMMLAAFVSLLLGNTTDTIFIVVVLSSNAIVGFYQEYKANKSVEKLGVVVTNTRVKRNGIDLEINTSQLVPGDIVVLRPGDKVPADGRIIELDELKLNEASLTGESRLIEKQIEPVNEDFELGDRKSLVFMGSIVEEGSGTMIVTTTGINTQYGDIVELLEKTPEEATPLQKMIAGLSKVIGVVVTVVIVLIVVEGYLAGRPMNEVFATALALFVSAIPEGLLPAITIVLSIGMYRIAKHKGLVRRLAATETLGGVTVICTDKTGTLTKGKMEVVQINTLKGDTLITDTKNIELAQQVLKAAAFTTDAYIENPGASINKLVIRGRSTDQAFLKAAEIFGIHKNILEKENKVIDSILFSSERKYSASLRQNSKKETTLYVIGATEKILALSDFISSGSGHVSIGSKEAKDFILKAEELMKNGYRLIACASTEYTYKDTMLDEGKLKNLTLIGFIVLNDPIRKEVVAAFKETQRAGIRTVIITGDNKFTAIRVAEKIGFRITEDMVLEGGDLDQLTDAQLQKKVRTVLLYARATSRHKLRIIQAFQALGEVVAMFGDGVNDAPALKVADIGVAVSKEVDATREVADILLLDSSFSTIVKAIEEGRIIFNNIRRVFLYLTTQDFSQFCLFFVSIALNLPLPLIASQLLFVNLLESGLPDLALTIENERDGVMDTKPRGSKGIINGNVLKWISVSFLASGGIASISYLLLLRLVDNTEIIRTMMTMILCFESLFLSLSLRSFGKSIFRWDIFSNKWLTVAIVIGLIMMLGAVYFQPISSMLQLVPLPFEAWLIIIYVNLWEIVIIDHAKMKFLTKEG
ncbi:MAG: cation-transporting P-type ATPase [Candidatus Dojkabacteria bacterium]